MLIMEVTEAERDQIIKDRIEAARKGEIEDCAAIIRNALQRIADLKGEVYVLTHRNTPFVDITASNIRVTAK